MHDTFHKKLIQRIMIHHSRLFMAAELTFRWNDISRQNTWRILSVYTLR